MNGQDKSKNKGNGADQAAALLREYWNKRADAAMDAGTRVAFRVLAATACCGGAEVRNV